jgi:hypothetical protein
VPHAAHFLERLDRVPRSLADFALDLYRDEDRVRWILHYAHLPKEEERVALALDPEAEGPYLVVTREGKFVTALAADMRPKNLTVLSRAQVDAFSARVDDTRRRHELAREVVAPGKRPVDMIGLLTARPWGLSREEFSAIAAWVPIMNLRFLMEIFEAIGTMDSFRDTYLRITNRTFRRHERTRETLESMWKMSHGIGARYLLATMGELVWVEDFAAGWTEDYGPTWYATDERVFSVAVRGAWAAARMGKAFLPTYRRILSTPGDSSVRFDAALAVTAIGLRHAHLRDDARRIVGRLVESEDEQNLAWAKQIAGASDRAFDDPDGALREVASLASKTLTDSGLARPEDLPEAALRFTVNQTFDSFHPFTFYVLPWAARLASPEELYLPEAIARHWRRPVTPQLMVEVYARHAAGAAPVPVTRGAPKPERNGACACGSGRKFKKCCGR